jgi:hypothetical protein
MSALPNAAVPLFDFVGEATPTLLEILNLHGTPPRGTLVDPLGRAQPAFRQFLANIAIKPLPAANVAFADRLGRPTRVFTMLLANLP